MALIYKICDSKLFELASKKGQFCGTKIDINDGFIHFCSASQIAETLALHFSGMQNLLLLTIDPSCLDVKWEPARMGELFPHLYDTLPLTSVLAVTPIPIDDDGRHMLPSQL